MIDYSSHVINLWFSSQRPRASGAPKGSPLTKTGPGLEIVKEALSVLGLKETDFVETVVPKKRCLSLYFKNKTDASKKYRRIVGLKLRDVKVEQKDMRVGAWRDKWKKDFYAFKLTDRFDVVPAWERRKTRFSPRVPIYLDTGLAFGTGLHETTKFMVDLITRCEGKFETFFDIGTGTGILSIAADRCGAHMIDAVDISPDAIEVANVNGRRNNMTWRSIKTADISKLPSKKNYDFVAANLITQDLIQFKNKILSFVKIGGYLAVSGISRRHYWIFRRAFRALPLKCLKIEKGEAWAAVLYQRIEHEKR
jgi:ribosomal protein L11 methyltransferase